MFVDKLIEEIRKKNNPTVVGLDPQIDYVPSFIREQMYNEYGKNLKGAAKAILSFNKSIIDAVWDIIPAVKPQLAYYEMYGLEGMEVSTKLAVMQKKKGFWLLPTEKEMILVLRLKPTPEHILVELP